MIDTKSCTKCGCVKPATPEFFYRMKSGAFGVAAWCKKCHAAWSANRLRLFPPDQKAKYHARAAAGTCVSCGARPAEDLLTKCARCSEYGQRRRQRVKAEVFSKYGSQCQCCGERELPFLTLDHIEGGGNAHRRSLFGAAVSGQKFYSHIKAAGFPVGYQVLCWNCNMAKAHFGVCPHVSGSNAG